MNSTATPSRWILLLPVYQDWEAAGMVLEHVDRVLAGAGERARVVVVDDGSTERAPSGWGISGRAITSVEILRLKRNLGHQRAICIGLAYLGARPSTSSGWSEPAVIIMDADGEDKPEDLPRLMARFRETGGRKVIFAERTRRSEGVLFSLGYAAFRGLHRALTGIRVRFGNFSVVPAELLPALGASAELWSHYAATVLKARLPYESVPTVRGTRLAGRSHMNLTALVIHGFTALSVFAEAICVRALLALGALLAAAVIAALALAVLYGHSHQAFPGWGVVVGLLVLAFLVQGGMMLAGTSFLVLFNRSNLSFLPSRDYEAFVAEVSSRESRVASGDETG
jgi:hypothetical protein